MSSINTNVTAMAAIRSLSSINNNMQTTQARVESVPILTPDAVIHRYEVATIW